MSLRCKKGDMAIIVKGVYAGHFVTVLEFVGNSMGIRPNGDFVEYRDLWLAQSDTIEHPFAYLNPCMGKGQIHAPDHHLLPIRPGDLQESDETEKEIENV